jgi:hypothetical protein
MDLLDIAKSWYSFTTQPKELIKRAEECIQICDPCENKIQVSPIGQTLLGLINKESSVFRCTICSCPLAGKVFSESGCPAGKW